MKTPRTFIFLGRSGCGKGTQADLLETYLEKEDALMSCFHLNVGSRIRQFVAEKSYTSELSEKVNSSGGLQPEFIAVWAWCDLLISNMRANTHLIMDGSPRKFHEIEIFDKALKFYQRKDPFFVHLHVSRAWAKQHMLARARGDDSEAVIDSRLDWYEKEVEPVIEFFRKSPDYRFLEIDGEQSIEKVHQDIVAHLK